MEATKVRKGPPCRYQVLGLSASDKSALDAALGRRDITGKAIEVWLAGKGIDWRQFNVNRHRRLDCGCSR